MGRKMWSLGFWICVTIVIVLLVGIVGFHFLGPMDWPTATFDASMCLAGMGVPQMPKNEEGKYFASAYAIFNGVFLLVVLAALIAKFMHLYS